MQFVGHHKDYDGPVDAEKLRFTRKSHSFEVNAGSFRGKRAKHAPFPYPVLGLGGGGAVAGHYYLTKGEKIFDLNLPVASEEKF